MAGGSFGNPPGAPLNAMSNSLFAQMDSMRRTSVGVQDIFSNRMFGASPSGGGQALGGAGDTLFRLNQTLEKMTQQFTQSPMMTGNALLAGRGVSAGQMMGAMLGAPVQMMGMPGGQLGGQMGRLMFAENVELGLQRMGRGVATDLLPGLAGAAASLLPGGALLGPMVGMAGQAYAPMALRALGVDASLNQAQMARQFRMDIGSRMAGGSVAGRFLASAEAGRGLSQEMAGYITGQQEQYSAGAGFLNFGLSADEYAPLQQAMTATMGQSDLKRLLADKKNVIKEQMDALISVSATLNLTFKETADLARQFGEVEGGAGALAGYVQTIEDAAQRAGGGVRRGMAAQFGLAMRTQARQMGLQGELTAGMAVQDLGVLQGMMNQTAGQRMLTHDQLAAFGGASEQERLQNMVQSMFNAGATIAQGPVGAMIRGNILAGNAGMQGGMLGMMGAAGGQFARDPFGFMISQADPRINQQVQTRALFTHMGMLEEAFGGLDPQAASAAFISKAGSLGLTKVQAGALQRFYQSQKSDALEIAGKTPGVSVGRVMSAANAMADQLGISPNEVMARMKSGSLSLAKAEGMASGVFGFGRVESLGRIITDERIEERANKAGNMAAAEALANVENDLAQRAEGLGEESFFRKWGGRVGVGVLSLSQLATGSPEVALARSAAIASTRQRLMRERTLRMTSTAGAAFARQNASVLRRAGVSLSETGELAGGEAFGGFSLESFGRGPEIGAMVRALATGGDVGAAAEALRNVKDGTGFKTLLSTLGALSTTVAGKEALETAPAAIKNILNDHIVNADEVKGPALAKLVEFMQSVSGKSAASALAFNALRPMINDSTAMMSLMQTNVDLLATIAENTKREQ